MLGLKRTSPLITDIKARRTLYLSLVKSQLSYATEIWPPVSVKLRTILERVQRRATRWIIRTRVGEMSYKQALHWQAKIYTKTIRFILKVKVGKVCLRAKWPIRPALISGFCSIKRLGILLLPPGWDASPS